MTKTLIKKQLMELFSFFWQDKKKNRNRKGIQFVLFLIFYVVLLVGTISLISWFVADFLCVPLVSVGMDWMYFALMGLVGIIIASCVNLIFLRSSMFDFIVSIVGVLIFVGLTAYDANKAKRIAATSDSNNALAMSMYCALELYLDFINLFLRLLSLFGKRK